MNRKEELFKIICKNKEDEKRFCNLIDEILFLEDELVKLKKLPFIKTHPTDPFLQKSTPAAKLYKELLQQYTNCIKILNHVSGQDTAGEDSPLRAWVRKHVGAE